MDKNEKYVVTVDIPDGFEIDKKASNFLSGKLVFKPFEITWEDAINLWNKSQKDDYRDTAKFYFNHTPCSVVAIHEAIIWSYCFRNHPKINRDSLTKRECVILKDGTIQDASNHPRGALVFHSEEEARFVNSMMYKYNDSSSNWSDI